MYNISVIIPVHNNEHTVQSALKSVKEQTLSNIEVICIDDGSTDNSYATLKQIADQDEKVKVYHFPLNQGTLRARKYGVQHSTGKYIMFLDADDSYTKDACECAFKIIESHNTDMVQFSTKVINCVGASAERIQINETMLRPYAEKLKGNLVKYCFENHLFSANLWNKIYNGALCRKAFSHLENSNLRKGEDWYTFFVIAYFSKTYYGIENQLYCYHFGAGGTGSTMDLNQYQLLLTEKDTFQAIKNFLANKPDAKQYDSILRELYFHFLDENIFKWVNELIEEYKPEEYKKLADTWGEENVLVRLATLFWDNHYSITGYLKQSGMYNCISRSKGKKLTLAFYYRSICGGGAQRVAALLSSRFAELKNADGNYKYRIILVTDDGPQRDDYCISEQIIREYVPAFTSSRREKYRMRYTAWRQILDRWNIDIVISGLWVDPCTFWDMLAIKSHESKPLFFIHSHNFCAVPFMFPNNEAKEIIAKYILADGVVALSQIDEKYISAFNPNVKYIVNPIAFDPENIPDSIYGKNTLVWCGRISVEKKPLDLVSMMQLVVNEIPTARLLIVGDGDKWLLSRMKEMVREYHLENNISFEGFQLDVGKYYSRASIFVNTSEYEGFPLTFSEAMSYALPIITYAMPWLTFIKDGRGIISVPQRRYDLLAAEVIKLLKDEAKAKDLGSLGKEQITEIAHRNIIQDWEQIFSRALYHNAVDYNRIDLEKSNENILFKYMTLWQDIGRRRAINLKVSHNSRKELQQLDFDIVSLENSVSFKVGRAITWLPRKIRGGIWCLRDNGVAYTLKRVIEHAGIDMGTGDFRK